MNNESDEAIDFHVGSLESLKFSNQHFIDIVSALTSNIISISISANNGQRTLLKEDRCRLLYLRDTIDLICTYFSKQRAEVKCLSPFQYLFQLIISRMEDILERLQQIECMQSTITNNFDIFELKLRGYLEELNGLFPLQGVIPSPLAVISGVYWKTVWETHFGLEQFVSFKLFVEMLENEKIIAQESEHYDYILKHLRYFLNFPESDVVTAYKFNYFINIFGPDNFTNNFQTIMKRKGFLGLINRIQAYEILVMYPNRCLFIRTSRTEPQFLAFSSKDANGKISHRLNKDSHGNMIPIGQFISSKFHGYPFVKKSLDVDMVLETGNLSNYASSCSGYFH